MTKVRVLDALSVLVMIEQCDLDWTIVTVWHTRYWGANRNVIFGSGVEFYHPVPVKATMCLRCLLNLVARQRSGDGRHDLVEAVKLGSVQVVAIGPHDGITRCGKCDSLPPPIPLSTI